MPIHGFLPTTELTAEVQEKERQEDGRAVRLVLRLDADERTLACYPFMFTLRIIYELKEDTLRITYEVENDGAEEMYFESAVIRAFRRRWRTGFPLKIIFWNLNRKRTAERWKRRCASDFLPRAS